MHALCKYGMDTIVAASQEVFPAQKEKDEDKPVQLDFLD